MPVTDIYKLPWPELSNSANAPGAFQNLAQAIEDHAFPSLQSSGQGTNLGAMKVIASNTYTVATFVIPSTGIAGWVDIDADAQISMPSGTGAAGWLNIFVNGSLVRGTRYHNWWRADLVSLYNSIRYDNVNGLALNVQVQIYVDVPSVDILFNCGNWGWQIYGKKVT